MLQNVLVIVKILRNTLSRRDKMYFMKFYYKKIPIRFHSEKRKFIVNIEVTYYDLYSIKNEYKIKLRSLERWLSSSSRGWDFNSHHHMAAHFCLIPVPGHLTPSHRDTCEQNANAHGIKINKTKCRKCNTLRNTLPFEDDPSFMILMARQKWH